MFWKNLEAYIIWKDIIGYYYLMLLLKVLKDSNNQWIFSIDLFNQVLQSSLHIRISKTEPAVQQFFRIDIPAFQQKFGFSL